MVDRRQILLGIAVLAALVWVRIEDPPLMQELRLAYFDTLQRLAPREYEPAPVRVVDIDEASLARVGQWPWPRDILADLVVNLQAQGAAVVVFDVLFAEADRFSPAQLLGRNTLSDLRLPDGIRNSLQDIDYDERFAASFQAAPVVLGTAKRPGLGAVQQRSAVDVIEFGTDLITSLPKIGDTTPIVPVLRNAAAGIGSIDISPQSDASRIRTVPLLWQTDQGALPGIAIEALRVAFGEEAVVLWGDEIAVGVVDAVGVGQIDVPTRADGQFWMHFRHDAPELYVSAKDVLQADPADAALREKLEGHIVFVGTSAAGLLDIRTTALGEAVAGVSIHAQLVEQILLGKFLKRSDIVGAAEVLLLIFVGLLVGYRMVRSGPAVSFATGFGCALVTAGASWIAFTQYSLLLDASFPLIGGFIAFAIVAGYQFIVADRDKRELRRSFSRYVAPTVLQQIEDSGYALELGGEIRPASVLFCDIRDFTPISERYSAVELVSFLNALFDRLSAAVLRKQGTIDKFIGDSVMAFWNAPLPVEDHPARAVEAALEMRSAVARFNRKNREDPPVRIAIGVATGEVCVGNIGSADRFDYSVIGDTVNVAARLEAACREVGCDILISEATRAQSEAFAYLYAGALELKGVSQQFRAWIVCGDADVAQQLEFRELSDALEAWQIALSQGASEPELAEIIARAAAAAQGLDPGIQDFVGNLMARRAAYAHPASLGQSAA